MKFGAFLIPGLAVALMAATGTVAQQALNVPSGQPVTLGQVLVDDSPGEIWVRFRFIAPDINAQKAIISADMAATDMDYLCQSLALPYLAEYALEPVRVIISLSDRDVPFGTTNPTATQFFEAYRPEKTTCIWEAF